MLGVGTFHVPTQSFSMTEGVIPLKKLDMIRSLRPVGLSSYEAYTYISKYIVRGSCRLPVPPRGFSVCNKEQKMTAPLPVPDCKRWPFLTIFCQGEEVHLAAVAN